MISFELSENDQKFLDQLREQGLVARKYARHYDENEHEFPPDELPEAGDFPPITSLFAGRDETVDTGMGSLPACP